MATRSESRGGVRGIYETYVGEVRASGQVYGYVALVLGLVSILGGLGIVALGRTGVVALGEVLATELVALLVSAGGVGVLLGAVLQMPLHRRAAVVAALGAVGSLIAAVGFVQVYPGSWGAGPATTAIVLLYLGGLCVVALVAALAPVATGRRSLLFGEQVVEVEQSEGTDPDVASAVMRGEAATGGVYAVFPGEQGWRWWFVEQAAVADGRHDYETQADAEAALGTVREHVETASLLEVTNAAFRVYDDGAGVRWRLVDADGHVLADSAGRYEGRERAEATVSILKEHGPDADVLDVDDGAFEVYGTEGTLDGDAGGTWQWRLVDARRESRATGPTEYEDRTTAEAAVATAREHLPSAPLMDVEHVGFELVPPENAGADEPEGAEGWRWRLVDETDTVLARATDTFPTRAAAREAIGRVAEAAVDVPFLAADAPAFEVVADGEADGWRWRLVDDEDVVVARSERRVPSPESGRAVVSRLQETLVDAEVLRLDDATFEVYPSGDQWRWRLVTADRRTVATCPGGTTFETIGAARDALARVRSAVGTAHRIEFDSAAVHLYESADGNWNWRLVDADGRVISDSGSAHASKADAAAAMNTMREHAPDADLVEIESPALECYEGGEGWHWRLVDATGETLATSPEHYETVAEARTAMESLELLGTDAPDRRMDAALFQVTAGDDDARQWSWRLVHPDGSVVATSTRTFPDASAATAAAETVAGYADGAAVHTIPDLAVRFWNEPAGASEGMPDGAGEGGAEATADPAATRWHWALVDRDREVVALGAESYPDRDGVAAIARRLRDHAGGASVFVVDPAAVRLAETADGWQWQLVDHDRASLAVGAGRYPTREAAIAALEQARDLADGAPILDVDGAAFEVVELSAAGDGKPGEAVVGTGGGWRWQYVDPAGTVLAASAQTYDSPGAAESALDTVRASLADASLLDVSSPAFELHESGGIWRWRLVDAAGATVAEGLGTYETRAAAREALASLRAYGSDAAANLTD